MKPPYPPNFESHLFQKNVCSVVQVLLFIGSAIQKTAYPLQNTKLLAPLCNFRFLATVVYSGGLCSGLLATHQQWIVILLFRNTLHSTVLHCYVLSCTVLYCSLYSPDCSSLLCTVLQSTTLCCHALQWNVHYLQLCMPSRHTVDWPPVVQLI